MGDRLDLHGILKLFANNVYFQPPSNIRLVYPCIVYAKTGKDTVNANNQTYTSRQQYQLTVIDENPDSKIADNIQSALLMCAVSAYYTRDNLNHTTLTLHY